MDLSKEVEYRLAKWIFANIYHEGKIDEKTYHQLLNRLLDECKPVECLEYVVTHELVHLVEKNHTNRFHALVAEYYPTWQEAKKVLNTMPLDYMESGNEA